MAVRFTDNTRVFLFQTRREAKQFLVKTALMIEREAKLSMRGGGKPHVPSRPGEPPRVDTGTARRSITHEVDDSARVIEVAVGTNLKYLAFLELGTVNIEPRPWLRPALMKVVGRL